MVSGWYSQPLPEVPSTFRRGLGSRVDRNKQGEEQKVTSILVRPLVEPGLKVFLRNSDAGPGPGAGLTWMFAFLPLREGDVSSSTCICMIPWYCR